MRTHSLIPVVLMFAVEGCGQTFGSDIAAVASNQGSAALIERYPWPRIGAPVDGDSSPRNAREAELLADALRSLRESWPARPPESAHDLRSKVAEYERAVKVCSDSTGYGNLLLAHAARRLAQVLAMQYVVTYPADFAVVQEILNAGRVDLLNSPALLSTLSEQTGGGVRPDAWQLGRRRADWQLAFKSSGSSFEAESRSMLASSISVTRLSKIPNLNAVLTRVLASEVVERVTLPGLLRFLDLGGRLADVESGDDSRLFVSVMGAEREKYHFEVMGINMLRPELIGEIVRIYRPYARRAIPFAIALGE